MKRSFVTFMYEKILTDGTVIYVCWDAPTEVQSLFPAVSVGITKIVNVCREQCVGNVIFLVWFFEGYTTAKRLQLLIFLE